MSEVIEDVLKIDKDLICVVSGPNLSLEIASEQPAACVAACTSKENAAEVAAAATNSYFTTFTNKDVIGTEFGGILKNLIAVAIGIVNGVGYGQNTKASIMTRGLAEISRFAVAHGAKKQTMLGKGYSKREVLKRLSQTAEGLTSVAPILRLAALKEVKMPIVEQVQLVIEGKMSPKDIGPSLTSGNDAPEAE
jgi:glycerol-3-phosphate dehydrogenase (NAD(P)+)